MEMDPATPSPDPPPQPLPASKSRLRRLLVILLLAVGIILLFIFLAPSDPSVRWLSPAQLSHAGQPGAITQFKRKLINLTSPLWRWYHPHHPFIHITSTILSITPQSIASAGLGVPISTNQDGLHAWLLSADQLTNLQQRLAADSGAKILSIPRVQTIDDSRAVVTSTMNNTGVGPPFTWWIELVPKARGQSIRLTAGVALSGTPSPLEKSSIAVTNLSAAVQVLVPAAGALVMDGGPAKSAEGHGYLFIISPVQVDAHGNTLKP
jgi:hypothetical protein